MFGKARKSKTSLKKNDTIQFSALENVNTFKKVYSKLARGLQEKLLKASIKFTSQKSKNFYAKTSCNTSTDFE